MQHEHNLTTVSTTMPYFEQMAKLEHKLYYDRIGYDNVFNFVDVSVKDGVATLSGETRTDVGRDSAVDLVNRTPGVKDVVNTGRVAPASLFDEQIRGSARRASYRYPVS